MGEEMHKFLVTLAELQAAVALGVSCMQVKEHPGYRRVKGAAQNHVYMGISVALAWEQAQLVIRRVESCERRWGNRPGTFRLVSARVGGCGAWINSMGLLPPQ
jgi:hypothetical protein